MKLLKKLTIIILITLLFLQTPSFQYVKSLAVMSVYSEYEAYNSVLREEGIKIKIPGGLSTLKNDWFPFVITFNDDRGFSWYTDRDLRMTVLYNFGHFPFYRHYSSYYDPDSPYYNSFYGAYAVKAEDGGDPYGFPKGIANIDEMGSIPTYDMERLVLISIGNSKPEFSYDVTSFEEVELLGETGWYQFNADMKVSGSQHIYEKDYRAYIQYGRPPVYDEPIIDYEVIDMKGRIYGKYYQEKDITLFFYCITTDQEQIDLWETQIMAETTMTFNKSK